MGAQDGFPTYPTDGGGAGVASVSVTGGLLTAGGTATDPIIGLSSADVVTTTGAQTIAGVKTFSSPPVLSGASIASGTIPTAALVVAPAPATRAINTGTGLQGGGNLTADRTLSIDSTVATLTGTQTLTGKSMSGGANTFTALPNSALTNSSLTIGVGTGLTGGGSVSLGGTSTALAVSYGSASGTATQGNDTRLPPAPGTAGKILYDTGSAYAKTDEPGGPVSWAYINNGTWNANEYLGIVSTITSATATNVVPWRAPADGFLYNFGVQAMSPTTGTTLVKMYKSAGGDTINYSSNPIDISVTGIAKSATNATAVAVSAGDLVLWRTDTFWDTTGVTISAMFRKTLP